MQSCGTWAALLVSPDPQVAQLRAEEGVSHRS
jgi:hypothetical protein